ncbi:MAG: hypothetical protein KDK36_02935 [Leptospiraceae bacterium]|nr:hypothetical protein [Leptospiraceae bacterium]
MILTDLINEKFEYELSSIWIGLLGEVISFDKTKSEAKVNPLIKIKNEDQYVRLPIIKCPVATGAGNNMVILQDYQPGDLVELKGNIFPIDSQIKGQVEIAGPLRFQLANCTIVGSHIRKPLSISPNIQKDGLVIGNILGLMYAQFSSSLIEMKIGITPTEKSVLGETLKTKMETVLDKINAILDGISALTVTCTAPGSASSPPINAATFTTIKSEITTLKSELGETLSDNFKHN